MWDAPLDIHVRCGIPNILFGRRTSVPPCTVRHSKHPVWKIRTHDLWFRRPLFHALYADKAESY
jgi:hypothetical protein